jgi:hypothetical protein
MHIDYTAGVHFSLYDWTCGLEILWLVFFYNSHLSILFCVQPWDKFRTLGCYLHHTLNEIMFDDGSGSLPLKRNIAQAYKPSILSKVRKVTQIYHNYTQG